MAQERFDSACWCIGRRQGHEGKPKQEERDGMKKREGRVPDLNVARASILAETDNDQDQAGRRDYGIEALVAAFTQAPDHGRPGTPYGCKNVDAEKKNETQDQKCHGPIIA
jgi:hypothetical protein